MPRPRRSTKQGFYDVFADFDVEEQAIVLDFLVELHRQARRQADKLARTGTGKSDAVAGAADVPLQMVITAHGTEITVDGKPVANVFELDRALEAREDPPEEWPI